MPPKWICYPSPSRPSRHAFTLVELLTVIAIIGILAAIIIPVVGKVRESARRSADVSNLRQLGVAILTFTTDHGNRLPISSSDGWWPRHLFPYYQDPNLLRRPNANPEEAYNAANSPYGYFTSTGTVTPSGEQLRWWYWINASGGEQRWQPFQNNASLGKSNPNVIGLPLSRVEDPSRTVAMVTGYAFAFPSGGGYGTNPRFYRWSNGKSNVLWLDGRVDSRGPTELNRNDFAIQKGIYNEP